MCVVLESNTTLTTTVIVSIVYLKLKCQGIIYFRMWRLEMLFWYTLEKILISAEFIVDIVKFIQREDSRTGRK